MKLAKWASGIAIIAVCLMPVTAVHAETPSAPLAAEELLTIPVVESNAYIARSVIANDADSIRTAVWAPAEGVFELVDEQSMSAKRALGAQGEISVDYGVQADGTIVGRSVNHARADQDTADGITPTQWSAGTSGVSLTWAAATTSPVEWTVSRNEEIIHVGPETSFTDTAGDRSATHDYRMTATETIVSDGQQFPKPYLFQVTVPPTDTGSLGKSIQDEAVLSAANNADVVPEGFATTTAATILDRTLAWQTFIPDYFVEVPPACVDSLAIGGRYFGGDNRTFKTGMYSAGTFRTRVSMPYTFNGPPSAGTIWPNIPTYKDTGYTNLYNDKGNNIQQGHASTGGIAVTYEEKTDSYIERLVTHAVADPLCFAAPTIDYRINFHANAIGWMGLSGSHDQAPSHEAFWQASNNAVAGDSNGCWYRFANRGLEWLVGGPGSILYPQASVDLDANPLVAPPTCPTI